MFIYTNIAGYLVAALAGLALGTSFGRKLATDVTRLTHLFEERIAKVEHALSNGRAFAAHDAPPLVAGAADRYTGAIEKLAAAIEKHAEAIDEHGAATVAAAVESRAPAADNSRSAVAGQKR